MNNPFIIIGIISLIISWIIIYAVDRWDSAKIKHGVIMRSVLLSAILFALGIMFVVTGIISAIISAA